MDLTSNSLLFLEGKSRFLFILLFSLNFIFGSDLYAQNNCKSANGGGNWQVAGSWTDCGGNAPTNLDNAIITQGNPISLTNVRTINNLTVEENASFTSNTGSPSLTVAGNFEVNGTMSGIAALTLNGINKTISGSGNLAQSAAITITNHKTILDETNLFIEGNISLTGTTTITNQGEISISGNITGASNSCVWTNEERSILNIGGTIFSTASSGILNAFAVDNTVNYYRSAVILSIPSVVGLYPTYHHVTISGSGSKTLPNGTIAINGNLTLNSTLNGSAVAKILRVRGNWINNSNTGFTEGFGTVIFDGSEDQSISKTTTETFNNLIVDKSVGTLNLRTNVNVGSSNNTTSTLTMISGNINCDTYTLTLGKGGVFTGTVYTGVLSHSSGIIIGKFNRYIESNASPAGPVLFPVGSSSYYRPSSITFSNVSVIGSVTVEFNSTFPGSIGLPDDGLQDSDGIRSFNTFRDGFWTISSTNSFSSTNYSISLTGTNFIEVPTNNTRILRRLSSPEPNLNSWAFFGNHVPYTSGCVVSRSELNNIFGDFAFGDDTDCTNPAAPTLIGSSDVCAGTLASQYLVNFPAASSTYIWSILGSSSFTNSGSTSVNFSDEVSVDWSAIPVEGSVEVFETTADGCSGASIELPVYVLAIAPGSISGLNDVPQNADKLKNFQSYSTPSRSYYTSYEWSVIGGEIAEIVGVDTIYHASLITSNSVLIKWGNAGQGQVCVKGNTVSCGTSENTCFSVSIYSLIYTVGSGNGTWTNNASGRALWNCNCIPTSSDNVLITSGKNVTVAVTNGVTVKNLIIAGQLNTGNNINRTITVTGNLTFVNGTIGQTGTNLAPVILSGGSGTPLIDGIGTITNQAALDFKANRTISAAANITKLVGPVQIDPGITVYNSGTVTLGGDIVGLDTESTWINASGSALTFSGASLLSTGVLIASFTDNNIHYNNNAGLTQSIKSASYYNLELSGDSEKTASSLINVGGNFLNNGTATTGSWIGFNPNGGTVIFDGTQGLSSVLGSSQKTTFQNVTVSNTSGVYIEKDSVDLLGVLNVGSGAFIDADGASDDKVLTLRSSADDFAIDASIGSLPATNSVRGNVTVQRYMSPEDRLYRYLSSPVDGANVSDWMDDFPVTGRFPGRSTMVQWPLNQLCNNTPLILNNASLFYYNESVPGDLDLGYVAYPITNGGIPATTSPLERGRGYSAFIRLCNTPTIIDVRGPVHQGLFNLPVTFTSPVGDIANDGWNLVGNPYPSAIDWDSPSWTKTNVSNVISIRDNGTGGGMRYYDGDDGDLTFNGIIASGQAFWVRATAANPELTISEGVKVSAEHTFYRKSSGNNSISSIVISLKNNDVEDRAFIKIRENTSVELDNWDATKLKNETFGISTLTPKGAPMAISSIPEIREGYIIPIRLDDVEEGSFELQFTARNGFEEYSVELTDDYLGIKMILNWGDSYAFSANGSDVNKNRFTVKLITHQNAELKVIKLSAYPNPVRDVLTILLPPDGASKSIEVYDQRGLKLEFRVESPESQISEISFTSWPSGVYLVFLKGSNYANWAKVVKK